MGFMTLVIKFMKASHLFLNHLDKNISRADEVGKVFIEIKTQHDGSTRCAPRTNIVANIHKAIRSIHLNRTLLTPQLNHQGNTH